MVYIIAFMINRSKIWQYMLSFLNPLYKKFIPILDVTSGERVPTVKPITRYLVEPHIQYLTLWAQVA